MAGGLRAGDADRDATIEKLEAAYADGRITGPEREHRVSRALAAVTRDDLATLTRDLEIQESPDARRRAMLKRAGRRNTIAVLAVIVVLPLTLVASGIALIVATVSGAESSGESYSTSEAPAIQLHTADGFDQLVAMTRDRFGSSLVVDAAIYPDYARLTVPVADSDNRLESWYFRGEFSGEPTRSTRLHTQEGPDIDLSLIDADLLADQVARTATEMRVSNPTATYVVLDRDYQGTPYYSIYASNDYSETGYWRFAIDGTETARYPFEG